MKKFNRLRSPEYFLASSLGGDGLCEICGDKTSRFLAKNDDSEFYKLIGAKISRLESTEVGLPELIEKKSSLEEISEILKQHAAEHEMWLCEKHGDEWHISNGYTKDVNGFWIRD